MGNQVNVVLTATSNGFSQTFDSAGKSLKKFEQDAKDSGKESVKVMDSLKANFGRGSEIGQFGKLLTGGGAIVGLKLIAKEINEMTQKMVEARNEFAKGNLTAGEMAFSIGKSLPIIGQLLEAGENLHELFTGEKAAQEALNKEAALGLQIAIKTSNAANDAAKASRDAAKAMADQISHLKELHDQVLGIKTPAIGKAAMEDVGAALKAASEGRDKIKKDFADAVGLGPDRYTKFATNGEVDVAKIQHRMEELRNQIGGLTKTMDHQVIHFDITNEGFEQERTKLNNMKAELGRLGKFEGATTGINRAIGGKLLDIGKNFAATLGAEGEVAGEKFFKGFTKWIDVLPKSHKAMMEGMFDMMHDQAKDASKAYENEIDRRKKTKDRDYKIDESQRFQVLLPGNSEDAAQEQVAEAKQANNWLQRIWQQGNQDGSDGVGIDDLA